MTTSMIVRRADPYNAEPPPAVLIERFLTPPASFYVPSHGAVPLLRSDHAVAVTGIGVVDRSFTLAQLQDAFAEYRVTAVLQCAGNRRTDFQEVAGTAGDPWDGGAIGNAEWTGARLADVLDAVCGAGERASHVGFTGTDQVDVEGEVASYGVSIGMDKAREPDVLLAWAMNGEPLAPEHGAPLRLIVPGYAGVRSAKWLTRIELRDTPSDAPIQAHDYKLFPAGVTRDDADWGAALTINAMPLNAAICTPVNGEVLSGRADDRGLRRCLWSRGVAGGGIGQWRP